MRSWNLERLSSPLESGAGQNLRYEAVYDQIQEARAEEDPSLSMGVWARDLKKADWEEVYKLCVEALENTAKDLQLVCWVGEAICHLENWDGLEASFELMNRFCENCWEICYPEWNSDDLEYRVRILDWFLSKMTECLLFMPITRPNGIIQQSLDLAVWLSAQNLDSIFRRAGNSETKMQEAENSGQITLRKFRGIAKQASVNDLQNVQSKVLKIIEKVQICSKILQDKCNGQEPSFQKLLDYLFEIDKICQFALEGRSKEALEQVLRSEQTIQEGDSLSIQDEIKQDNSDEQENNIIENPKEQIVEENNDDVTINNRQDAYKAIGELADFLIDLDSQSPGPYLIKMVSSWSNKSLPDILEDITTGTSEGHKILKLLGSFLQKEKL